MEGEHTACKISGDDSSIEHHQLENKWTLWTHLPHDTDWTTKSYKNVHTMTSVEETIALMESLPEVLVVNCMLFIMKEGIIPVWEDTHNRNGGCFSYKIGNKNVYTIWKELSYMLTGKTLSTNRAFVESINGITISPKKSFCIIKIWLSTTDLKDPSCIINIPNLLKQGCLFKKHVPEF